MSLSSTVSLKSSSRIIPSESEAFRVFAAKEKPVLGRVFLLEDDCLTGEWLATALAKRNIEVHWAVNVDSAMQALMKPNPIIYHAVITDIFLKGESPDGMKLVHAARQIDVPVCVISSRPDLPLVMEAINNGASLFLQKPFDVEDLFHRLGGLWSEPKHLAALLERLLEMNRLTEKEREVCRLVFKGLSNKEIATVLNVTEKTIKFHVTGIFQKFSVQSRSELTSTVFPV